jgi:hypothetical protein
MAFTETELLVDISQEELDGIAKELVEMGHPDPVEFTIGEQLQKVTDYTVRYELPEERLNRLTRALVLFELYARLQSIPEKRQLKYDEAMKELKDIRDGKFPDLPLADPTPDGSAASSGAWGSDCRI